MSFRQITRVKSESSVGSNNMEDIEIETSSLGMTLETNMKGFIDKYFFTNLPNVWSLESFVLEHDRTGYVKKNCLYLYKEGLQNICKSSEFDDEVKSVAKKLVETYEEDKRKCTNLLDSRSARADILRNRLSLLVSKAKSANDTIDAVFTEADASLRGIETPTPKNITRETEHFYTTPEQLDETSPEILPRRLFSQVESDSYVVNPQGSKRDRDSEEEGDDTEEFNADQTITGGKNVSWVVDGIDIREKFTEYQLETKLPKTKPEYYDVIFFNAIDKNCFLETLEKNTVIQMLNDITEEEKETSNNIEQEIKSLLQEVISRDINMSKKKLNQRKRLNEPFEREFALHFVNHMIELMEDTNLLLESISEGTYIVSVLGPILNKFFIKNKKGWRVKYGETCLRASAKDRNSQKEDDKRRSAGNKIDAIITLKEEDEEFSVVEVSGPPSKQDWTHFKGDRMKIVKMLKTLMNRLAELRPNSDIRKIKLYAMQSYLHEIIVYEFRLKYAEIYTMIEILRFPLPKTWKDMKEAYEVVMGLLKYERFLSSSSEEIQDFMWYDCKNSQKMTTRMIYSPGGRTKKARTA
ncbi:14412_t:CDS:2 [Funneliformis mosseae]|uniref:14412_t:CDS:1 n=1 Tax=Funneliformis mosseae TaxID=27381 RepID=A0A9N9GEG7_FUNMO|nr:14412_t:CDS:2 [Funneliformis mosseae]